jgi:hypothetical protein
MKLSLVLPRLALRPSALSVLPIVLLLASIPACSSSSSSASEDAGHPDAPVTSDGGARPDTGTDAEVACNTLANSASVVPVDQIAQDPPTPQGGTIASGTYTMTAVAIYTGAGGPTGQTGTSQTTIQITGDTIQVVSASDPATRTVTIAPSGTSFTATDTCPDTTASQGSYTATASSFVIQLPAGTDDAGARTLVETFALQ